VNNAIEITVFTESQESRLQVLGIKTPLSLRRRKDLNYLRPREAKIPDKEAS
jgi:hypothetical protein